MSLIVLTVLVGVFAAVVPSPGTAHAAPVQVAAPEIVPFDSWAPAACPRPTGEDAAPVRRLVVHHTHEPVAHTPEQVVPALVRTCDLHTARGFSTIGYHYVVDPWGKIWQGRGGLPDGDGRPPATHGQGAHVAGSNNGAVGVVFLGDHAAAPPTAAALESATHLLAWLIQDTAVDPAAKVAGTSSGLGTARFVGTFETAAVSGHSDTNHTECPGEHLYALLDDIRSRMRQHVAGEPVAGWDGLAAPDAVGTPVADPDPVPAPASASSVDPSDKAAASTEQAQVDAAASQNLDRTRSVPVLAGPVRLAVDRVADTLRDSGLFSLADRLGGDDG